MEIIDELDKDMKIKTKVIVFSGEPEYIAKLINSKCVINYISKGGTNITELRRIVVEAAKEIENMTLKQKSMEYLLKVGYSSSNKGTYYLRDCIEFYLLCGSDECVIKEICFSLP